MRKFMLVVAMIASVVIVASCGSKTEQTEEIVVSDSTQVESVEVDSISTDTVTVL